MHKLNLFDIGTIKFKQPVRIKSIKKGMHIPGKIHDKEYIRQCLNEEIPKIADCCINH